MAGSAALGAQALGEIDNRLSQILMAGAELRNSDVRQALYAQNAENMQGAIQADADTNAFSADTAGIAASVAGGAASYSGAGFQEHLSSALSNISAAREENIHNLQERGNIALKNVIEVNAQNNAEADNDVTDRTSAMKMLSAGGGIFGSIVGGLMLATKGGKTTFQKSKVPDKPGVVNINQAYFETGVVGGMRANPGSQGGTRYLNMRINQANERLDSAMNGEEAGEWEVTGREERPTAENAVDPHGSVVENNWNDYSNWFHPDSIMGVPYGTGQRAWEHHGSDAGSVISSGSSSTMPAGAEASSMMGRPGWFNVSPAQTPAPPNSTASQPSTSASSAQIAEDTNNNTSSIGDATSKASLATDSSYNETRNAPIASSESGHDGSDLNFTFSESSTLATE